MTRTTLRDRIVANVRSLNAQVKTPVTDKSDKAPRTVVLLAP